MMEKIQSKNLAKYYWEQKLKATVGIFGPVDEPIPGLYQYRHVPAISSTMIYPVAVKKLTMTDLLFEKKWRNTNVYQEYLMALGKFNQLQAVTAEGLLMYIHCAIPLIMLYAVEGSVEWESRIELGDYSFIPAVHFFNHLKENRDESGYDTSVEVVERVAR